ncbi:MAG TPA: glucosidase, partial [Calditrichia bacterium]|nr:glucosidase [Calditrichia bacterium]
FDKDRYFDVFVEYAKADEDDICIRVTAHNRGAEDARLSLLPTLWFRNTWSWDSHSEKPLLQLDNSGAVVAEHPALGEWELLCQGDPEILFCENESNARRLFGGEGSSKGFYKDGINDYVVAGRGEAVNPRKVGTKAAAHYWLHIAGGSSVRISLRLCRRMKRRARIPAQAVFAKRIREADQFYQDLQSGCENPDERLVQRQAFAGMIWSKQYYFFDVATWLAGDPNQPAPPPGRTHIRNGEWGHLRNADIISMPDKWEYPWYAAWDLAFHCIPLALIDPAFAKHQLVLLTREWYMHPNGQLPAYEWDFSDVNPPVHAWATWRVYKIDAKHFGKPDLEFLERVFHKLLLNFTWWVNRKDKGGNNIFQGGFLGLDNIGVFNRAEELPTGGHLEQADGTSWMAMYCLNMMRIALELAAERPNYQDLASKFLEHFLYIAEAMTSIGEEDINLWDDQDKFYYDVLNTPADHTIPLKIHSIVGLIPLFAVEVLEPDNLEKVPAFRDRLEWLLENKPNLASLVSRWEEPGLGERRLLSLLRGHRMKRLFNRMLDEGEFLSAYGVRALSKFHQNNPYVFQVNGEKLEVRYLPGESDSGMFGGNSNWRGPVWMPINYLIVESMQRFYHYYGDDFRIEYPTGSGEFMTIAEASQGLTGRIKNLFLRNKAGERPAMGASPRLQKDPHFRDYILFYEYFHGDSGEGLGASHQTGWTGLIAKLLQAREE